jgi:hypothetical protein
VTRDACHQVAGGKRAQEASGGVVLDEARNPAIDAADILFGLFDLRAKSVAQFVDAFLATRRIHGSSPRVFGCCQLSIQETLVLPSKKKAESKCKT